MYIQIDDDMYKILSTIDYRGMEIAVVLEVKEEDESSMGDEVI